MGDSAMMMSVRVAPPLASGPYDCDCTATRLSYSTAASARIIAAVITPCPPEPEKIILHRSMALPFHCSFNNLLVLRTILRNFLLDENTSLDQRRVLLFCFRTDRRRHVLQPLHHVHR